MTSVVVATITARIPEPAKRRKSLILNIPPVSRPKVTFEFIAYEADTATNHDITFDAIKGSARSLYAVVKTKTSMAVFITPIEAKLSNLMTRARLCQTGKI